ncbi:glycosyl transferase family 1 [Hydrocoleum sp. CS-953]|uniref:glycosyltransferase family 4 protein n=1 Tax=Hydrocoleum sp. CS-953 TaxID=1671698 RepID=UPI000B9B93CA|nr:glycosyltransferase family 4 protein [Hydrocoleum sp. CS-953]OZH52752.1 glycosyl transferase family 1 [Hydrocoleum sp. CS-953]
MKILISSYACMPYTGSEPAVGWNMVQVLAKRHQVWVITREDNRPSIEAELIENPCPGAYFIYYDLPPWARWWYKKNRGVQLHYYLWQIGIYFIAKKLHREIGFDMMHHVTYCRYWNPSFIALLPVPFIWGPVGGGESTPKQLWKAYNFREKIYETVRDFARWLGERDSFVKITAERSTFAFATTEETASRLRLLKAKKVKVLEQCGLQQGEIDFLQRLPSAPSSPIRFISIGRILHWKGFQLGFQAFAMAKLDQAEYWVVGEGPYQKSLREQAEKLGISSQVKFWGWLARDETWHKLGDCHVLLHPSLHESGGLVCLEAMAARRPVVCLDLGGPGKMVTEETGFKIVATYVDEIVSKLADAMTVLARNSDLRMRMGKAAEERIKETYNWRVKANLWMNLYEEVAALCK